MVKPNVFIIGAQKSATTSIYDWISQHPDVCGPNALKDYPYFLNKNLTVDSTEDLKHFNKEYFDAGYSNQKIILHGSVQYMFEKKAIENIYEFNPNAKLICVLRNPTDRAISAYNYFKKLNLEKRTLKEAIEKDNDCLKGSIQERHELTYVSHGLYAHQLKNVYNWFDKDQLLVLMYEDVINKSKETTERIFDFLKIDLNFIPEFRHLNSTGKVRFKLLQNIVFNDSKIKKFIVENIIDLFIPLHKRTKLRLAFSEWNTKNNNNRNKEVYLEEKDHLKNLYKNEIRELETIIGKDLKTWK